MSVTFPPKIALASLPTPFYRLDRLSEELGEDIWIKRDDMTGSVLSGNKVRKLEFILAKAKSEGADTIITCGGLQSNHCRATAFACAQLGLSCCLVLRGNPEPVADGNLLMDFLAGAEVRSYPVAQYAKNLQTLMIDWKEELKQDGRNAYLVPTGASDGVGIWGYLNAAKELKGDFNNNGIKPQWMITATGSGGTQAGLSLGASLFSLECQVLGFAVCDNEQYFHSKVASDIAQWSQSQAKVVAPTVETFVNDQYIGPGYAKAEPEVFKTIHYIAKSEGLLLDPVYTGKAFHGMISEVKRGNLIGPIVFVHTGGAFGVFPYKQNWSFNAGGMEE